MADDNIANNYAQQIAQMRAERNARSARVEAENISNVWKATAESRDEAAVEGDHESFEYYDKECEALEKEWAALPQNQQQQPSYLTEENSRYVQRCADLNTPVNDARFRQAMMTAEQAGLDVSNHEVFKEVLSKYLSPGVFQNGQLVPGTEGPIVPPDYQPMPDRDEAFKITNNSKYGCRGEDYVRGEAELRRRKNLGHYSEK